jgi:hypothetical protein
MIPTFESRGILQETPFISADSRRNRPEKYTEDGSSIPAEIFPYRNRQRPSISCYRKENRTAHIPSDNHWNLMVFLLKFTGNKNISERQQAIQDFT